MHRAAAAFLILPVLMMTAIGRSQPSQSNRQMTVGDVVRHSRGAVVQIVVSDQTGNQISLGSGFLVSADGKVVTNYHVIKGARTGVAKLADGTILPVEGVLALDTEKDLAVLKVDEKRLPFLRIASTHDLNVGDHVVAIGSPLGLEGTVSDGIVSALREEAAGKGWIQTTAPVSPGNSGGPLLNMSGSVIGVIARAVSGEKGQNLNFAIPSEEVESLLSKSTRPVPFGFIEAQSDKRAFTLYKKACDEGDLTACDNVGLSYEAGKGVAQDFEQARLVYERSCAKGNTACCVDLGHQFGDGRGVAQDEERAIALYQRACDLGDPDGCRSVGEAIEINEPVRARTIFKKACDDGDMPSCSILGDMYERGIGVAINVEKAFSLYRRACAGGYKPTCDFLDAKR